MTMNPPVGHSDRLVDDYLERTHGATSAFLNDPQYHRQVKWFREMLRRLETAMGAEHIPGEVQDRVIHRLLYGSLDEDTATVRMRQTLDAREALASARPHFGPALLDGITRGEFL